MSTYKQQMEYQQSEAIYFEEVKVLSAGIP